MNRKKYGFAAAVLGMTVLILDSRGAAQAAAEGVAVCIRTVIPSLFPFFLLSGYLTGAMGDGGSMRFLSRIFRSSPNCGSILAAGLLGGYPLGAKLARESYASGRISRTEANRLLSFCSQAGPSFLFGIVASQFAHKGTVWLLWAVQILSALSVAWVLPSMADGDSSSNKQQTDSKSDPMRNALYAMAAVCGWVIVCGVILRYLKNWLLWLLPRWAQVMICGLLELTNGCLVLSTVESEALRFLLAAVMLNFGGMCVMLQTASLTRGLNIRSYVCGKALQVCFAAAYAGILEGRIWLVLPIFLVFSRKLLRIPRKRYSISEGVGV